MFSVHDKVVYPGYGVASISCIIEREVSGQIILFFELQFLHKEVTILVPMQSAYSIGLRKLSSKELISEALEVLKQPARRIYHQEFSASSWNKRNKDYQNKLRAGSIKDLSEIYRDLRFIEQSKGLSFGEKAILGKAEALLAEEISLVDHVDHETATARLRSVYAAAVAPAPSGIAPSGAALI